MQVSTRATRLASVAVVALLAVLVPAPARAATAAPGAVAVVDSWGAVDGGGVSWTPPLVTDTAGAPTSYLVARWNGVNGSPDEPLATVPAVAGQTRYSFADTTAWTATVYSYVVTAVNDAGSGPRVVGPVVAQPAPLPADPFDVAYADLNRAAVATTPAAGALVTGDRHALHVRLASPWATGATLTGLDSTSASNRHLVVTTPSGDCELPGAPTQLSTSWYADGTPASLLLQYDGGCGLTGPLQLWASWNVAASQVPALPVYDSVQSAGYFGHPLDVPVTVTNAGPADLPGLVSWQAAGGWTVDPGTCATATAPGAACTATVSGPPTTDAPYVRGTATLAFSGSSAYAALQTAQPAVLVTLSGDPDGPSVAVAPYLVTSGAPAVPFTLSDPQDAPATLTARCRVDAGAWAACVSPWTGSLAEGRHVLDVQGTDPAGHVGGIASAVLDADTSAPVTAPNPVPLVTMGPHKLALTWSAAPSTPADAASYDLRYRYAAPGAALSTPFQPSAWQALTATGLTATLPQGYEYCFSVRGRDTVGNVSAWSGERCTTVPLDDPGLADPAHVWTRARTSLDDQGTVTLVRRSGAALVRDGVQGRRLGLVVTTCPSCGAVDVWHAGVKVGRVTLTTAAGSPARHRVVLWLPASAATRNGRVLLRTVDARPVLVDGLVVLR